MVVQQDRLKNVPEVFIGIFVPGIDATVLVLKLNSTGNGSGQGKSRGLRLDVLQLLPYLGGQVLGHQALF